MLVVLAIFLTELIQLENEVSSLELDVIFKILPLGDCHDSHLIKFNLFYCVQYLLKFIVQWYIL